jgi:hypothetical protein
MGTYSGIIESSWSGIRGFKDGKRYGSRLVHIGETFIYKKEVTRHEFRSFMNGYVNARYRNEDNRASFNDIGVLLSYTTNGKALIEDIIIYAKISFWMNEKVSGNYGDIRAGFNMASNNIKEYKAEEINKFNSIW